MAPEDALVIAGTPVHGGCNKSSDLVIRTAPCPNVQVPGLTEAGAKVMRKQAEPGSVRGPQCKRLQHRPMLN